MPSSPPSELDLPSDASAPGLARRHSAEVLRGWRLGRLADVVLIVTSELVTNAVRHGARPIRLVLKRQAGDVRVEVQDGNPRMGPAAFPDHDAESGRGQVIVDALSSACGVDAVPGDGKVAWAVVSAPSGSEG